MALSCRCRQWSWRLIAHWDLPWCGHFLVVFQIWSAAARVIMSSPSDDSELRKYSPKWAREQPATSERLRSVSTSTSMAPWSEDEHRDRRIMPLRPEPVPEPPAWWADGLLALIGRLVTVAAFAAVIALLVMFGKPLLQRVAVLEPDSPPTQVAKPSDPLTENEAPATRALVPTAGIVATPGAAPPATAQGQQAALSPISKSPQDSSSAVRGVTDSEIRFGISAPFTGPAKELGQNMKIGIEAAFNVANAKGGVYGRQLRLIAADDGYEPTRTVMAMKELDERDQVFGLVGNVGTPTAAVALPYALDRKMLFFGAFTGAGLLRNDPPDRYVFNYRASYAEETAAVVNYLVKVRRLLPEQIAVFAQQDAYGDSGFAGVEKAIRSLRGT